MRDKISIALIIGLTVFVFGYVFYIDPKVESHNAAIAIIVALFMSTKGH